MENKNLLVEDEPIDYLNDDFADTIKELDKLSKLNTVKIEVNEGLEEALKELDSLHDQFSKEDSAKLLDLCKNTVIETVTGQFGLSSLFIEAKDGGNVTTAHNMDLTVLQNKLTASPPSQNELKKIASETTQNILIKINQCSVSIADAKEAAEDAKNKKIGFFGFGL